MTLATHRKVESWHWHGRQRAVRPLFLWGSSHFGGTTVLKAYGKGTEDNHTLKFGPVRSGNSRCLRGRRRRQQQSGFGRQQVRLRRQQLRLGRQQLWLGRQQLNRRPNDGWWLSHQWHIEGLFLDQRRLKGALAPEPRRSCRPPFEATPKICASGMAAKVPSDTAYGTHWGALVGWNINQADKPPNDPVKTALTGTITVGVSGRTVPMGLRIKVAVGATDYCAPLISGMNTVRSAT